MLKKILAVILAVALAVPTVPVMATEDICYHKDRTFIKYQAYETLSQHDRVERCNGCGITIYTPEDHTLDPKISYQSGNDNVHRCYQKCTVCGYQIFTKEESHTLGQNSIYTRDNATYHEYCQECTACGACIPTSTESHTWRFYYIDNDNSHSYYQKCTVCGYTKLIKTEQHTWGKKQNCNQVNANYHSYSRQCTICGAWDEIKEKHTLKWTDSHTYGCTKCGYVEFDAYGVYYVKPLLKNSTKISLEICGMRVCKGDLIKVKIGTKTYKKTITKSAENLDNIKYTIKIKKPKKNSKVTIDIYHRGKKINLEKGYVLTSKDPQKGMTKTQVIKYTSWGRPGGTETGGKAVRNYSGGITKWYYWCYSTVTFKNGKVKSHSGRSPYYY